MLIKTSSPKCLWKTKCILGEGTLWSSKLNSLFFVDIKEKKILGAGLDVFNEEPYSGKILELDNVILTPHIGAYAREIRMKMEVESAKNLIKGLQD